MKKTIFFALLLVLFSCKKEDKPAEKDKNTEIKLTTIILVRHAEKESGANPNLTDEGKIRAEKLKEILADKELAAVYATNYNRTMQTAQPTALAKELTIKQYNPTKLDAFADSILINHKGKSILVVGHSNTTPSLANILLDSNTYSAFPETEYGNIITVTINESGKAEDKKEMY